MWPVSAQRILRGDSRLGRSARLYTTNDPKRLHPVGRVDADEIEAARDHGAASRGRDRAGTPAARSREHAVLVVEAMEVVGDADRVGRDSLRAALRRRVGSDGRELGEPLDQLALLGRERTRRANDCYGVVGALRRIPAIRACAYCT